MARSRSENYWVTSTRGTGGYLQCRDACGLIPPCFCNEMNPHSARQGRATPSPAALTREGKAPGGRAGTPGALCGVRHAAPTALRPRRGHPTPPTAFGRQSPGCTFFFDVPNTGVSGSSHPSLPVSIRIST